MRAAVLRAYHAPLEVVDRPDPTPGPGEVVLDVAACGLCARGFTPQDIRDVIDLYRRGAVTVDHLLTRRRPLEEVNEALADLQRGEVLRTIIEPKERA